MPWNPVQMEPIGMMQDSELLIVSGSVRSRASEDVVVRAPSRLSDDYSLFKFLEEAARCGWVSNSEGCGVAAAYAACKEGVTPHFIRLNQFFRSDGKTHRANELMARVARARALLVLTPVYFGDRSSLVHEMLLLMRREGLDLGGKVSAVISVGAKRNGGQETTNIFTLYNLLQMNSLVVGNGPPTSQYGGTAVGGTIGAVSSDRFGIETSIGVGKRLARALKLVRMTARHKPNIALCVLEDTFDRRLLDYLGKRITSFPAGANWAIHDLATLRFERCRACDKCPSQPGAAIYNCGICNDDTMLVHERLLEVDGIIVGGLSYGIERRKISNYQRFVERTRCLRRDDFRLSDRVFLPFSLNRLFADSAFDIRVLTSFVRHNAIGHRGVRVFELDGETAEPAVAELLESFVSSCSKSAEYRARYHHRDDRYETIGY